MFKPPVQAILLRIPPTRGCNIIATGIVLLILSGGDHIPLCPCGGHVLLLFGIGYTGVPNILKLRDCLTCGATS